MAKIDEGKEFLKAKVDPPAGIKIETGKDNKVVKTVYRHDRAKQIIEDFEANRVVKAEVQLSEAYDRYLDLLNPYERKKFRQAISNGVQYNWVQDIPPFLQDLNLAVKNSRPTLLILKGVLFTNCSGQLMLQEWIEIPKSKDAAKTVLALQSGSHSIAEVNRLLDKIWGIENGI